MARSGRSGRKRNSQEISFIEEEPSIEGTRSIYDYAQKMREKSERAKSIKIKQERRRMKNRAA